MEFLDRLLARTQSTTAPLKGGSLSALARDSHDKHWIDQCVADSSTQEAAFALDLLLHACQTADMIANKIETEEPVLAFLTGTSRDILIYEILHFCLHALSDQLRQIIPANMVGISIHYSNLACLAASRLGRQHIGEFDASLHRLSRGQRYLQCVGRPREMTECLIAILLSARGRISMQNADILSETDADIEVQVSLRGVVHAVVSTTICDTAEQLSRKYIQHSEGMESVE